MGIAMMIRFLSTLDCSVIWKISRFSENSNNLLTWYRLLSLPLPLATSHSRSIQPKRTFKNIEIQLELKSCRKWRIIAWPNVICTFYTFRIVRKILSHRNTSAHPANFYNIEHMSYSYWVSECLCVCAPFAYLLHIIRIASSISANYNKLAKYSPNSVAARSALFAHLKLIAKTLYIFVQLQPPLYSITSLWDRVSVYELHQMMRSVYYTCVLYRRS